MTSNAIISTKTAEHYTWGQSCDGWHLWKSQRLSIIQEKMLPGTSETPHYHRISQQVFYILSGEATFIIEDQEIIIPQNHCIHIAPSMVHCIMNRTENNLEFLVISEPMAHGDRENVSGIISSSP